MDPIPHGDGLSLQAGHRQPLHPKKMLLSLLGSPASPPPAPGTGRLPSAPAGGHPWKSKLPRRLVHQHPKNLPRTCSASLNTIRTDAERGMGCVQNIVMETLGCCCQGNSAIPVAHTSRKPRFSHPTLSPPAFRADWATSFWGQASAFIAVQPCNRWRVSLPRACPAYLGLLRAGCLPCVPYLDQTWLEVRGASNGWWSLVLAGVLLGPWRPGCHQGCWAEFQDLVGPLQDVGLDAPLGCSPKTGDLLPPLWKHHEKVLLQGLPSSPFSPH